jgi:dihydroorotase
VSTQFTKWATRRDILRFALASAALSPCVPFGRLLAASSPSLVIRGPMFTAGKVSEGAIRVENGLIVEVGRADLGPADRTITLAPGQTLVPAAIDTLCALRDWGETERDTVETATKAALAGGITVVCDQSNTVPRIDSAELVRKRSEFVAARSYVDFGIQPHPPRVPAEIEQYRAAGAFGVSVWQWDLSPWNAASDHDRDGSSAFRRYAELGLKGLVFPDEFAFRETSLEDQAETYALKALLRRMDPGFKARIFITLAESVDRLLAAKERLPQLLAQIAPHYLFLSREAAQERIGSAAAHSPPLRSAENVARLQEYAAAGKFDIFVSHHTSHRTVDKYSSEPIPGEFTPKRGFSSVDFAYPLYLSRLGFKETCRCFCENPARHLGLRKGMIARGYEADLAIVQETTAWFERGIHASGGLRQDVNQVDPAKFQSLVKVTPFVGERLKYRVVKTFLRGQEAYDAVNGEFKRLPIQQVR